MVINTLWQLLIKEKNHWELKESIRMMKSQRSDTENINLIEEGKKMNKKKIGIDEIVKRNEIINNSLKSVYSIILLFKV